MTMTETRPTEDPTISLDCSSPDEAVQEPGQYDSARPSSQRQVSPPGAPGPEALVKPAAEAARAPGHESHARTIVKSLTWRAGGLLMTVGVAWWITGKGELAASIGLADTAIKIVVYYVHERMWLKIPFGRARTPEYEI